MAVKYLTQPRGSTQLLTEICWRPSYQSRSSDTSWKAGNSSWRRIISPWTPAYCARKPVTDRQQCQLTYLAEMTTDFEYIAGQLSTPANTLSCPPAEEDADKVCAILPAESPQHWDTKELLAVQKEDHQTLAAKERLASTPDFSWPEKRGEGQWSCWRKLNLLRSPLCPPPSATSV